MESDNTAPRRLGSDASSEESYSAWREDAAETRVDLGDELLMRSCTMEDRDKVTEFNRHIHGDEDGPDHTAAALVHDFMSRKSPRIDASDFLVVEEQATGEVVSSLCLISQDWTFEGIPFGVGQPEFVGTLDRYRNRGLVRRQMEVVHGWSRDRGHLARAIWGIPYFYRQFGYEMALPEPVTRHADWGRLPDFRKERSPFRFRDLGPGDVDLAARLHAAGSKRSMVAPVATREFLSWYLLGQTVPEGVEYMGWMIESPTGEPIGYVTAEHRLKKGELTVYDFEIVPGHSWLGPCQALVEKLKEEREQREQRGARPSKLNFRLADGHPLYSVMPSVVKPGARREYAAYMRVPDIPAFLRRIAPALEQRITESLAPGYSGTVIVGNYRSALALEVDGGKLASVTEGRMPANWRDASVCFPDLAFLQLLFGRRTLDELQRAFPDCHVKDDEARLLLNTLFTRSPSQRHGALPQIV